MDEGEVDGCGGFRVSMEWLGHRVAGWVSMLLQDLDNGADGLRIGSHISVGILGMTTFTSTVSKPAIPSMNNLLLLESVYSLIDVLGDNGDGLTYAAVG